MNQYIQTCLNGTTVVKTKKQLIQIHMEMMVRHKLHYIKSFNQFFAYLTLAELFAVIDKIRPDNLSESYETYLRENWNSGREYRHGFYFNAADVYKYGFAQSP